MSQDLLSEFDTFYQPPAPAPPPPRVTPPPKQFNPLPPLDRGHRYRASTTTFDDLLGIMDTGLIANPKPPLVRSGSALQTSQIRRPSATSRSSSYQGGRPFGRKAADDPYSSGLFDVAPQRSTSTSDLYTNDLFDDFGSFEAAPPARRPPPVRRGHSHTQSLFDDFGSAPFVIPGVTPMPARHSPPPRADLFPGLTSAPVRRQPPTNPDLLSLTSTSPHPARQPSPPKPDISINPSLISPSVAAIDDDFGDFVASPKRTPEPQKSFQFPPPRSSPAPRASSAPRASPAPTSNFQFPPQPAAPSISLKSLTVAPKPPPPPPPEAFPPVAALLQSLAPLFLLPQNHLLDRLKGLPFPLRQRVLAHPKTKTFLEGVCEMGRVAGRIIAGRRRRGRGAQGARSGMKLGVATSFEVQKEEREVKEACRIWKEELGRLKAAYAGGAVPELDEDTLGAVKSSGQLCKLCKLGREEVLSGLKERTERARWWDEGWGGHGSCRGFWERHRSEVLKTKY